MSHAHKHMQHNLNNDLGEIEIELDEMSMIFNIQFGFFLYFDTDN
jgi:hypothetical protein